MITCVLNRRALAIANIELPSGPIRTRRYVIPSRGLSTKRAFDAFLYWRVSTVFAERSFVISTHIIRLKNIVFIIRTAHTGPW